MADKAYRIGGRVRGAAASLFLILAMGCLVNEPALAAAAPLPETPSLLSAIVKVFGSLLVVVGLMLVLLYFIKRSGLGSGQGRSGSAIAVLETRMVAPKKYIAIVEIADKCLAIGITDHNINLLADLGSEAKSSLASQTPTKPGASFARLLSKSMKSWQSSASGHGDRAMIHDQDKQESP